MAKKKIRHLDVRITTTDEELVRKLCRALGCSPSVLVRSLLHAEGVRRGMFSPVTPIGAEPLLEVSSSSERMDLVTGDGFDR